jgi:hypothetical protein
MSLSITKIQSNARNPVVQDFSCKLVIYSQKNCRASSLTPGPLLGRENRDVRKALTKQQTAVRKKLNQDIPQEIVPLSLNQFAAASYFNHRSTNELKTVLRTLQVTLINTRIDNL